MCLQTGWTLEYVRSLYTEEFDMVYKVARQEEARAQLMALNAAAYPHAKESYREKLHRSIHRIAYPQEEAPVVSMEQLAHVLASGGRG